MTNYQTVNGYNDDEVISALQKDLRRDNEAEAMYWALELAESGKSPFGVLVSRLKVIAYEDIGLGDPDVVLQVSNAIDDMDVMYKEKRGDWRMVLSFIILSLSRASKSRITDHFMGTLMGERKKGVKYLIPDYALDMHTTKGNEMGRRKGSFKGVEHFIKHGEYLKNENPEIDDIYKSEAHKVWMPKRK
jgi:replication-associated recombination protein RarA